MIELSEEISCLLHLMAEFGGGGVSSAIVPQSQNTKGSKAIRILEGEKKI